MILQAATERNIDLGRSVMVGDRWRDVAAGHAAGVKTVFVDRGYAEPISETPDLTVKELHEAVPWILAQTAQLS